MGTRQVQPPSPVEQRQTDVILVCATDAIDGTPSGMLVHGVNEDLEAPGLTSLPTPKRPAPGLTTLPTPKRPAPGLTPLLTPKRPAQPPALSRVLRMLCNP